jgi:hypothetical protein
MLGGGLEYGRNIPFLKSEIASQQELPDDDPFRFEFLGDD